MNRQQPVVVAALALARKEAAGLRSALAAEANYVGVLEKELREMKAEKTVLSQYYVTARRRVHTVEGLLKAATK